MAGKCKQAVHANHAIMGALQQLSVPSMHNKHSNLGRFAGCKLRGNMDCLAKLPVLTGTQSFGCPVPSLGRHGGTQPCLFPPHQRQPLDRVGLYRDYTGNPPTI